MNFQVGANLSTEPGQPHTAQSDNARSPSPEETPDITPLCKLTAEEAELDYQKQLNLLAEQTALHDAQRASEPSLDEPTQQIRLLESQVERQREVLGDSDPETLEAYHELCLEYQFNGQLEKAEELQRRIIDIRSRHLGESHPDTLRSLLYLTPIFYAKGEEEAADQLQLHVLATRERVLGQSHADAIESVEQLAVTYENEKQWDEALPLYTRVQEANSITYAPDHCSTLEASCAVARMHRFRGHVQEAWQLQDAAYQRSMRNYGPEHDCTQVCVAELAQIANAQGNKEKARKLQQGVVNYYVAKLGRDHPWTMEAFEDMEKLKSMHFALVVYPQFEVLDAFGPTETLHCLGHPFVNPNSQDITFSVIGPHLDPVSTGPTEGDPSPVKSRVAQTIVPTHTFDAPPKDVDVLIVPGGFGAGPKALHGGDWEPAGVERVVQFLHDQYPTLKHLLTVCNGAGLAARAGILDGQKATTNKQLWPAITALGPKTHWVARARWVVADNGKLWTSSGVSAGTDAMLALIDHIYGKNDQGTLYGDVIKEGMEWNRVYDSEADPFAGSNNVTDVPAQE